LIIISGSKRILVNLYVRDPFYQVNVELSVSVLASTQGISFVFSKKQQPTFCSRSRKAEICQKSISDKKKFGDKFFQKSDLSAAARRFPWRGHAGPPRLASVISFHLWTLVQASRKQITAQFLRTQFFRSCQCTRRSPADLRF